MLLKLIEIAVEINVTCINEKLQFGEKNLSEFHKVAQKLFSIAENRIQIILFSILCSNNDVYFAQRRVSVCCKVHYAVLLNTKYSSKLIPVTVKDNS